MGWPTGSVSTTHLDAGTDSPATARSDIKTMADKVNEVIGGRGSTDGVASLDSAGKVPNAQLPLVPIANGRRAWFADGTYSWTVPAGITKLDVEVIGGGGGGGFGVDPDEHGGGGGAGGRACKLWTVTPGDTVDIIVGAGGNGGAGPGSANGSAGGDSEVTINSVTITGEGGQGGQGSGGNGVGGQGGAYSASTGTEGTDHHGIGGGAGQSGIPGMGGVGGAGLTGSAPMPSGAAGWGSGGYGSGTNGPASGANGADGGALIRW